MLQIIQVTVPIFFYFDKISKMRKLGQKRRKICIFLSYLAHFWDFVKIKKIWNSNLDYLEQLLFHTFFSSMKLIFWLDQKCWTHFVHPKSGPRTLCDWQIFKPLEKWVDFTRLGIKIRWDNFFFQWLWHDPPKTAEKRYKVGRTHFVHPIFGSSAQTESLYEKSL